MTVKVISGNEPEPAVTHTAPEISVKKPYVYTPGAQPAKKNSGTLIFPPAPDSTEEDVKPRCFTGEVDRVRPRRERKGILFAPLMQTVICAAIAAALWAAAAFGGEQTAGICRDITDLFRLK